MRETRSRAPVPPGRAAAPPIRIFAPGPALARRYEIQEVLGTSPWGAVYRALDLGRGLEVALKVVRGDSMTEGALARLREDAGVAAEGNPRIARVLDVERLGPSLVVVAELVPGESLASRLEGGRLPVEQALRLAVQILEALRTLHTRGVLHRGLKPSNIHLLPDGELKLSDAGLTRRWERVEERREEGRGLEEALAYLSPEQAVGQHVETRSDLYSLGVVLFEMLAGHVPLVGGSPIGIVMAHLKERPPDVRALRPEVPPWLARVVARLLEKDQEERYGSAEAVLADLRSGHARLRWRRFWGPLKASTAAAALTAVAVVVGPDLRTPEVIQLVIDPREGARALSAGGDTLWTQPRLRDPDQADLVGLPGGGERIAAVLAPPRPEDPPPHVLTFVDRTTGAPWRRVPLPAPPGAEGYAAERVQAVGATADGADEVLVRFRRPGGGESYTVFLDLQAGVSRVLFASSGPHVFCGAADLDGDGRNELYFAGPNPRLEGFDGIAAVRLPVGEDLRAAKREAPFAATGDLGSSARSPGLLWYALVAPAGAGPSRVRLDLRRRTLVVDRSDGRSFELESTGFAASDRAAATVTARAAARRRAYEELRAESALGSDAAVEAAARAAALAIQASDRALFEAATRRRARALVAAGRPTEAARMVLRTGF